MGPSFVGSDSIVRSFVTLTSPLLARVVVHIFKLEGTRNLSHARGLCQSKPVLIAAFFEGKISEAALHRELGYAYWRTLIGVRRGP